MWKIIVPAALVVSIAILILILIRERKYKEFVRKNSKAIKKLIEISNKYDLNRADEIQFRYAYDIEEAYNSITCFEYMIYYLQFSNIRQDVLDNMNKIEKSKEIYRDYTNSTINNITYGEYLEETKLRKKKLDKIEKKLLARYMLKPVSDFKLNVELRYVSSSSGKTLKTKEKSFDYSEVSSIIDLLKEKSGKNFKSDFIKDAIYKVEASKVTKKMKLKVMKKENFKCSKCGKKYRASELDTYFVTPIEKNGKAQIENMKCICKECIEKSNEN